MTTRSPFRSAAIPALLLCATAYAQPTGLLVSSRNGDTVLEYDPSGGFVRSFASAGGLDNPVGLTFGRDGALYVVSANTNQVLRYDGATGAFLGVFASGLNAPRNLSFGPDGDLYVCNGGTDQVLRFDGATGAARGVFSQHGTLAGTTSMTFGPDRCLYVGSVSNNRVVRFDGQSGAFLGVFATAGQNGTHDLAFGPGGHLYVSNAFGSVDVVQLDGRSGGFLRNFVIDGAVRFPLGLTWGTDGDLYLANQGGHDVRRYDGQTGQLVSVFVAPRSGGLDGPLFTAWRPAAGGPQSLPPAPAAAGSVTWFAQQGLLPGGLTAVAAGLVRGTVGLPCAGQTLGIQNPVVLGFGLADDGGYLVLRQAVPPSLAGVTVLMQPVDLAACVAGPVLAHTF